jgi:hypothetical protein
MVAVRVLLLLLVVVVLGMLLLLLLLLLLVVLVVVLGRMVLMVHTVSLPPGQPFGKGVGVAMVVGSV